jgi:hypothetical protein
MFNLFKKQKIEVIDDQALVDEIHNEFDTAPTRLLEQALEVINKEEKSKILLNSNVEDKAERLSKLGFKNINLVKQLEEVKEFNSEKEKVIKLQLSEAELIKHYSDRYPFLKFLTESELDRICEKYNLIYAPVDKYLKNVPDKNLEEIENAQELHRDDKPIEKYFLKVKSGDIPDLPKQYKKGITEGNLFYKTQSYHSSFLIKEDHEKLNKIESEASKKFPYVFRNYNNDDFMNNSSTEEISEAKREMLNRQATRDRDRFIDLEKERQQIFEIKMDRYRKDYEQIHQKREELFIAAPKSHFDLTGLSKDGKGFYKTVSKKIEPKDPIVFRYVEGGIQVLTKWGLEGDDPALQLGILN